MNDRLRKLRQELSRRNNQKGFTLIELLVVISILGILAAVVTMSMVGVTRVAQSRAMDTERLTVQAAIDSMASEQLVPVDAVCDGNTPSGTNDMRAFPSSAAAPTNGIPAGASVALYPRYLRTRFTHGTYSCLNASGELHQDTYTP